MPLGLAEPLHSLVANRFAAARDSGALVFSATQLAVLSFASTGVYYQLRYCPSLAKKPVQTKDEKEKESAPARKGPKPDPFENPSRELLIAEIPGHVLVLNKFPVIPRHFILATKEFKRQTDLLERDDLEVAFACIQAWNNTHQNQEDEMQSEKKLFAFFNSGSESGASQPHRHLQFLPVEDMHGEDSGAEAESHSKWIPLIDHVATAAETETETESGSGLRYLPSLAFRHFVFPLPLSPSPDTLYQGYLSLYRAAVDAVFSATTGTTATKEEKEKTSGPAAINYNLAITESAMMICPRRSESAYLDTTNPGGGTISLNGTILAGTLMVKQEHEWERLRNEPQKIEALLEEVGF